MFHSAIKVVVVAEKFVEEDVRTIIESSGAKGYTLLTAGGKGLHGFHSTEAQASVVGDFSNIKVEAIVLDREKAERIASLLMEEVFKEYPGIVYLEDVQVWREERF